jgi:hypothetical protein
MMIERVFAADRVNAIANHPDIRKWVNATPEVDLDLSAAIADPNNITLSGEHGAIMFAKLQPNIYEVHTMVLPDARGPWCLQFVRECLKWVLCRTDALELLTRCPKGNLAAKALARAIHGVYQFTNPAGWTRDGAPVPADIYALTVQDWMRTAPGLESRGHWFHERLEEEFAIHGRKEPQHPDDDVHDRYVGAAAEMILGGQIAKGVVMYNRWALMAGYAPIAIVSLEPVTLDIGNAILVKNGDDFTISSIHDNN